MRLPTQMFTGLMPRPAKLEPLRENSHPWKPGGGLWTSSFHEGTSGWVEWCRGERFRTERVRRPRQWLLDPLDVRVFAVASADDVERVFDEYGVDYRERLGLPRLDDGGPFSDVFPRWHYWTLDWERFVADWDALWLASPWIPIGEEPLAMPLRMESVMFYGWDCESTWWARWSFENVRRPGR